VLGVTRIVGGTARGRRLAVPPRGTRPTSDRAREALFNTLNTELDLGGAHVLDLYAGSGAVGLEALSRGARAVVFVESDRRAAAILQDNINTLGFDKYDEAGQVDEGARVAHVDRAVVHKCTAETYLSAVGADEPFDFVFADPPYAMPARAVTTMLATLADQRWVAGGGVVVIERSWREAEPEWPSEIKAIKQRRYGEGCLWYGRRE
jgi:16S rRNA (guanine966-N2)-methyltransferase